ncbi:uncharacterized protein [Coffea arabica]|uniref:Uncharacterized protein n=1 Tax=Coffea arabica TaxID=13443 RepID=A0A6P6VLK3_COFAR|nr:uncharacterized protein LOC113725085 [Coffea arabica]
MAMQQLGRNAGACFASRAVSAGLGASSVKRGKTITLPPARSFCSDATPRLKERLHDRVLKFLDYIAPLPLLMFGGCLDVYYDYKEERDRGGFSDVNGGGSVREG